MKFFESLKSKLQHIFVLFSVSSYSHMRRIWRNG